MPARLSGICVDMRMILFNGKGLEQTGLVWRSGILVERGCMSNTWSHGDTVSGKPTSHRDLELPSVLTDQ